MKIASLIYFDDNINLPEAKEVIAKLKEQGYILNDDTREYDDSHDQSPCWYIPWKHFRKFNWQKPIKILFFKYDY